ncbi:MAG: phenylalanine--tRNA ligase subunit beta [Pseudomonadota bacterium]|nr:MAG: phenylalanine--tRNA ligase subunit beta [Pseudomonadota bacterium]
MKFSEQWLREWVNPPISIAELTEQLTMAGLEVDAVDPVAGEFDKVVVGEVLAVEPHPDADKLRVCQVNVGADAPLGIVCGAANVAAGQRVPTALVGAVLPDGLKIKKAKLRGVPSSGMLCSETELGLAEQAEGLMILPADAPVGEAVRDYLALDDVSIELGLTPNRGDCLSLAGVAREAGVLNGLEVHGPAIEPVPARIEDTFDVTLQAPLDCPHYVGRVIRGIDPSAQTPVWMIERLRRSGIRSLGPVVDVTNYVLLELGQPMHAFDLRKLSREVRVRHANTGETLSLLNGQDVTLEVGTLVIADRKGPIAMAGIMGGDASAVGDDTADIFLESAWFNPLAIAGRARRYGLHTDSSHRFERGVSPTLQPVAIERATRLLLDIVGGQPGPLIEQTANEHMPHRVAVSLRPQRLARVLGAEVADDVVEEILVRLGMRVDRYDGGWEVTPPEYRFDIEREVDLIEEIGRIYGYNRLPSAQPHADLALGAAEETAVGRQAVQQLLVARGYQEAITYSFVDPRVQQPLDPDGVPVALANPLSADLSVMRTTLWTGLLQTCVFNLNRQQSRLKLFEYGLKFYRQDSEIREKNVIAGLVYGDALPEQWGVSSRGFDFFDLKGDVEALLGLSGNGAGFSIVSASHPALHPGQGARIERQGAEVGWLGAVHPRICREMGFSGRALVFEVSVAALQGGQVPEFRPVSRFPAIRRDIAVLIDRAVPSDKVRECIRKAGPDSLRQVDLFDVYTGEGIDSGRKSLALGLTLQHLSRTLTDSEVEDAIGNILQILHSEFGATLRE